MYLPSPSLLIPDAPAGPPMRLCQALTAASFLLASPQVSAMLLPSWCHSLMAMKGCVSPSMALGQHDGCCCPTIEGDHGSVPPCPAYPICLYNEPRKSSSCKKAVCPSSSNQRCLVSCCKDIWHLWQQVRKRCKSGPP